MGKSKKTSSGLMSALAMAGAAVTGAAMGAVAAVMTDHKKRKSFEKTAGKVTTQVRGQIDQAFSQLNSVKAKAKSKKK